MKELPFPATEHEDGDKGDQHDHDGEKDGSAHGAAGRDDQLAGIAGHWPVPEMLLEMMRGVFRHDDRLVHQDADGNGDAGQRHDVGLDVEDAQ